MAVLGKGGGHLPQITITYTGNWSPPIAGNVCFHLVGAGCGGVGSSSNQCGAGGAGGYCKKNSVAVVTTDVFAIVVGAAGLGNSEASATAGGNTTVTQSTGSGLSAVLTANGGSGGTTTAGGAGGTAANGDVNNTGGAGQKHTYTDHNTGCGGSVGIYATGASGSAFSSSANNLYGANPTRTDAGGGGLAMSGYGQIVGGTRGGIATWGYQMDGTSARLDGEDLCGGGRGYTSAATYVMGGNGGIGAGGGAARYPTTANYSWGGNGGDGIVLIQYLP